MNNNDWMIKHGEVIKDFLHYLNQKTEHYVLKGGSSLIQCYGMDRFSKDVDLDSVDKRRIGEIVSSFCEERGYKFNRTKNTNIVQRYMIHYGDDGHPLKVETSFRRTMIPNEIVEKRNGIVVYDIDELLAQKAMAYGDRDKVRDMYDISFILNNYGDVVQMRTMGMAANALGRKGIEQYDYLVHTEDFEEIDPDKLLDSFLMACEKAGVLSEQEVDEEMEIVELEDIECFGHETDGNDQSIDDECHDYDEFDIRR